MTASGENMWGAEDAFYFAWRKVSGDLIMTADITFVGQGKNPHHKAGWAVREGLDRPHGLALQTARRPPQTHDAAGLGDVQPAVAERQAMRPVQPLPHGHDGVRYPVAVPVGQRHHGTGAGERHVQHAVLESEMVHRRLFALGGEGGPDRCRR